MKNVIAPIVIFIYKREKKFRKIVNGLRKIKPKKLFIVADGPKCKSDQYFIDKTRSVIKEIDWDVKIITNFANKNSGADVTVTKGLDWVFKHVEECIIIEDDCIVDNTFFYFATLMLNKYKHNLNVANIAANTTVKMQNLTSDYFFSTQPRGWGWATWKRAWQNKVKNIKNIDDKVFEKAAYESLNNKKFANFQIKQFYIQKYNKQMPNWDIFWEFNCYLKKLLTIYYKYNLVTVEGNDEHAFHQNQITTFFSKLPKAKSVEFPIKDPPSISVNQEFLDKHALRKSRLALIYKMVLVKIYLIINNFRDFLKKFKINNHDNQN